MKYILTLLLSFIISAHAAQSQSPLEIIVPLPPGGPTDSLARAVQLYLTKSLSRNVIVVNKPGADGRIASRYAVSKPSDGSSLVIIGTGPFVYNKVLYSNLGYDYSEFDMVLPIVRTPVGIMVSADSKISTLSELVNYSTKNQLNCGVSNSGGKLIAGYLKVKLEMSSSVLIVPYTGSGPAINDLLGGHINCVVDAVSSYKSYHLAKKIKIIALTGNDQIVELGHIPLVKESLPEFVIFNWFGVGILKGTPDDIKHQILSSLKHINNDADFLKSVAATGLDATRSSDTPTKLLDTEYKKISDIAKVLAIPKTVD